MPALLGLRAKTGRAIAVVLSSKGEFLARREIPLSDPAVAGTAQPYHVVMEMPWSESVIAIKKPIAAIEKIATASLRALIASVQARGMRVACIAIVGPANAGRVGRRCRSAWTAPPPRASAACGCGAISTR